jgi:hypothetical protein
VSPRTVGRYIRSLRPRHGGRRSQRWATFVRNHAHAVVACDFFTAVTARFRVLYVLVVLEVGTRRILHWNVMPRGLGLRDYHQAPVRFEAAVARGSILSLSPLLFTRTR